MAKRTIGKLPPKYSFILNPYSDIRLSKCPKCDRPTHPRKFALLIHVGKSGALVLGKTCRYCTRCELIIAHQDELEAELALSRHKVAPDDPSREYLVLGTVDRKVWQRGLKEGGGPLDSFLDHVAEFKQVLGLKVRGGWGPA